MFEKGQSPSIASQKAVKEYFIRFVRNASASAVAVFGLLWLVIEVASWFELKIVSFQKLGFYGYILLLLVASVFGLIIAFYNLFINLQREWLKIEISTSSTSIDSGEKLSSELVETVRRLHQSREHAEVVRLGSVLSRPLWLSGRYIQRVSIGTFFEDSAARLGMHKEQIVALIDDLGWTNIVLGNLDVAKRNINHGIKIALRQKEFYLASKGHRHLGTVALRYEKDFTESENQFQKAEQIARDIDERQQQKEMIAGIDYNRGELYLEKRDFKEAEEYARKSLQAFSELNDRPRMIKVKTLIARIEMKSGSLNKAKDGFREALNDARSLARRDEIGNSLLGLGETYLREGSRDLAQNILKEAIEVFEEINSAKELARAQELYRIASSTDFFVP